MRGVVIPAARRWIEAERTQGAGGGRLGDKVALEQRACRAIGDPRCPRRRRGRTRRRRSRSRAAPRSAAQSPSGVEAQPRHDACRLRVRPRERRSTPRSRRDRGWPRCCSIAASRSRSGIRNGPRRSSVHACRAAATSARASRSPFDQEATGEHHRRGFDREHRAVARERAAHLVAASPLRSSSSRSCHGGPASTSIGRGVALRPSYPRPGRPERLRAGPSPQVAATRDRVMPSAP